MLLNPFVYAMWFVVYIILLNITKGMWAKPISARTDNLILEIELVFRYGDTGIPSQYLGVRSKTTRGSKPASLRSQFAATLSYRT